MKVRHLKRNALPRDRTGGNTQWVRRRRRKEKALRKSQRFTSIKLVWNPPT